MGAQEGDEVGSNLLGQARKVPSCALMTCWDCRAVAMMVVLVCVLLGTCGLPLFYVHPATAPEVRRATSAETDALVAETDVSSGRTIVTNSSLLGLDLRFPGLVKCAAEETYG